MRVCILALHANAECQHMPLFILPVRPGRSRTVTWCWDLGRADDPLFYPRGLSPDPRGLCGRNGSANRGSATWRHLGGVLAAGRCSGAPILLQRERFFHSRVASHLLHEPAPHTRPFNICGMPSATLTFIAAPTAC